MIKNDKTRNFTMLIILQFVVQSTRHSVWPSLELLLLAFNYTKECV